MRYLLIGLLLTLPFEIANAAPPRAATQVVYGLNAFDGEGYSPVFSPGELTTIYLMEGVPNLVQVKRTEVYYWPSTEQFVPDWAARNEDLNGRLRIWRGREVLEELEKKPFVLVFPQGPYGARQLATGEVALAAHAQFLRGQQEHERARERFYQEHVRWLERAQRGEARRDTPPPEPVKSVRVVSKPGEGFVVSLPAGRYHMALVGPDGVEVAESQREMVVFGARRRGIGYKVIPAVRWTNPLESQTPEDVIYVVGSGSVFLQPMVVQEFNELLYARLRNPQDKTASGARWTWVSGQAEFDRPLRVERATGEAQVGMPSLYLVEQVEGNRLGYRIVRQDRAPLQPREHGFRAYEISVPASGKIRVVLICGDRPCPTSERQIAAVHARSGLLYGVAALPLVIAVALGVGRRFRRKTPRQTEE